MWKPYEWINLSLKILYIYITFYKYIYKYKKLKLYFENHIIVQSDFIFSMKRVLNMNFL
jgi:hypothetical protein